MALPVDEARIVPFLSLLLIAACGRDPVATQPASQAGWARLSDWEGMPVFEQSNTHLFTSHERETTQAFPGFDPGNKDFNGFLAVCGERPALFDQQVDDSVACAEGQAGYLIAADDGPGYVSRMSLTLGHIEPDGAVQDHPDGERIRIYADDMTQPVYDGAWADWSRGSDPPFEPPLTGWTSGTTLSYVPISYSHALRIFLDGLRTGVSAYYPHVTTHSVASTSRFDPAELATPAARAQLAAGVGGDTWLDRESTLPPHTTITAWEREQPGTVQSLEVVLPNSDAVAALAEITLALSWDDEAAPAIELPLAAWFGARHTLASFETWPMVVRSSGDAIMLRTTLPMPFARRARVALRNDGAETRTLQLRIAGTPAVPSRAWGRLRASWAVRSAPADGARFVIAELSGRGKYVGTIVYLKGRRASNIPAGSEPFSFLEGDERVEVDGEVGLGTGTEDCFGGGWYFIDGRFDSPFAALIDKETDSAGEIGQISAVRWNILSDAVNFSQSFRLSLEYGANMPETAIEYAAVGFYYQ